MSRSRKIHDLAYWLGSTHGVRVDADYEHRGGGTRWRLSWSDGPTVDAMVASAKARGRLPAEEVASLDFHRSVSVRAVVAAFAARLLAGDAPQKWEAGTLAAGVAFPDGLDAVALEVADAALARFQIDPNDSGELYADEALTYLDNAGRDGALVDLWLDTAGVHPQCQPGPPALDVDTPAVRAAVRDLYRTVQRALLGRSAHAADHRARQLAAQAIRHAVPAMLTDCQRADAAAAVVDGYGLRSLSQAVGLGERTLHKTLGGLDDEVRTLTWLREHAEEWSQACRSAADALHRSVGYVSEDDQRDVSALRGSSGRWQDLIHTVSAARRLVAATRLWGSRTEGHRVALAGMIEDLDRAEPPTSRERHSRKGMPVAAPRGLSTTATRPSPD